MAVGPIMMMNVSCRTSRLITSLLLVLALPVDAQTPKAGSNALTEPVAQPPDASRVRVLLAPEIETTLVSPMAGRIAVVNVGLGESFTAGKTLLRFVCDEQQARLEMANAELSSARETYEAKRRMKELQQAGRVEVAVAASNAEKAQAQVKLLRVQLDYCTLNAPFDGRVVKIAVKAHQGVNQAQPLLEVVSAGPLKLRLNVPAKWVMWLRTGATFEVAIDETAKTYQARVSAVNGRIDAVSQTVEIEATIADQAPELLPGMSGTAQFKPPT